MDLGLKGRSAFVGGSTRGIGFAIARTLAAEGAQVLICGRNGDDVESARRQIAGLGHVHGVAADLSTPAGREDAVRTGLQAFGKIDIAVINVGGPPTGGLETLDLADWRQGYETLVESAVHLSRLLVPAMAERNWGRLLAITSFVARQPADGLLLSNSLRAAVAGLIRSIANEYGARGVTANTILPGYIRTDRMERVAAAQAALEGQAADDKIAAISKAVPLGRIGDPQELADVAAFIASDRASYLTGASITVDGGMVRTIY